MEIPDHVAALGPLEDAVLVIHGSVSMAARDSLLEALVERYGPRAPLLLVLAPGMTVEALSEEEMRECGWVRITVMDNALDEEMHMRDEL